MFIEVIYYFQRGLQRIIGEAPGNEDDMLNPPCEWVEGELEKLVGMKHILCEAVGMMHSEWPQLRYIFTCICYFHSILRRYHAPISQFNLRDFIIFIFKLLHLLKNRLK